MMTRMLLGALLVLLLALATEGAATVYTKPTKLPRTDTIVVLNKESDRSTYSKFFALLADRVGGNVRYTTTLTQLKKYGEYLASHIIVFGVQTDLGADFLDFVDNGAGNVIVVANPQDDANEEAVPESQQNLAIECGVLFTEKNVQDQWSKDPNVVVSDDFLQVKSITGGKKLSAVHYRGLGIQIEKNNPLLLPILRAPRTAVVPSDDDTPQLIGTDIALVAGLQARNGARMTFVGSTALFSDSSPQANLDFAAELLQWSLQFRGVLRFGNVKHALKDPTVGHEVYRIKDVVNYEVQIEEFTGKDWEPYVADDIQLEFVMLDPYIRTGLKYNAARKVYTAELQLPDVYGIFKLLVDYRRPGYSPLIFTNVTTVRPLKLNEYERFIPSAFPYYLTVFLSMGGFLLFSILFFGSEK